MSKEKEKETQVENEVSAEVKKPYKAKFDASEFGVVECGVGSVQLHLVGDKTAIMTIPILAAGATEKTKVDDILTIDAFGGDFVVLDIQHYPK
jgi:hypothetical protein